MLPSQMITRKVCGYFGTLMICRTQVMMIMMTNCFVEWVTDKRLQVLLPLLQTSDISNMLQAGFEPAQNLSSGLIELCAVGITTTL